ncbi:MAG: hypothetical protein H0W83_00240 [Planctomycetes bacterium]|nr:hypothetical protein [Planctomycetota bacterium]
MRDPESAKLHVRHRDAQSRVAIRLAREVVQHGKVNQAASLRPWRGFFRVGATSLDDLGDYRLAVIGSACKPSGRRALAACKQRDSCGYVPIAEQVDLIAFEMSTSPEFRRLTHHLRSRLHGRRSHHNRARRAQRWKGRTS